jgi:orotate phosphoribosyltransferase
VWQIVVEAWICIVYIVPMEDYKKRFAQTLAETGAIFFAGDLILKDGRPTPYFVNMAMFKTGRLSLEMGSFFAGMMLSRGLIEKTDIILGPSYKGSSIALATAIALWKDHGIDMLFDYDRKEAKDHGEASSAKSMFVNGTFFDGCRIFVVDDVATSMGTKYELLRKIEAEGGVRGMNFQVSGIGIGIDREQTTAVYDEEGKVVPGKRGKNAIGDFVSRSGTPVYSVAGIREIVKYLYEEKVPVKIEGEFREIDERTKAGFEGYLKTYGIEG